MKKCWACLHRRKCKFRLGWLQIFLIVFRRDSETVVKQLKLQKRSCAIILLPEICAKIRESYHLYSFSRKSDIENLRINPLPPNKPPPEKIIFANKPPSDKPSRGHIRGKHNCRITSYFKETPQENGYRILLPLTGDKKAK